MRLSRQILLLQHTFVEILSFYTDRFTLGGAQHFNLTSEVIKIILARLYGIMETGRSFFMILEGNETAEASLPKCFSEPFKKNTKNI